MPDIHAIFESLPPAVALVVGMVVLGSLDFLSAVFTHLRDGTFQLQLLGKWVTSKGLPIIAVVLLFVVDESVKLLALPIEGFDIGVFGMLATAQAGTFILQEVSSIKGNLETKPPEEPVPDEIIGG